MIEIFVMKELRTLRIVLNAVTTYSSDICFLGTEMWKIIKGVFSGKQGK